MSNVVIDNRIWIRLLLEKSVQLNSLLTLALEERVKIQLSEKIQRELSNILKFLIRRKHIDRDEGISFLKAINSLSSFNRNIVQEYEELDPQKSHYVNVCLSGEAKYLVPYNYDEFKSVDGYKGINVIELENFLENLR